MSVTESISTKLTVYQQIYTELLYCTGFYKNPTDGLGADTRSRVDVVRPHVRCYFIYFVRKLEKRKTDVGQ